MGKHSYDDFTEVSDIMRCTRIYPFGIGAAVEITITRGVHSDNNVFATGMVPSRPTGAHRFHSYRECPDLNTCPMLALQNFTRPTQLHHAASRVY